MMSFVTSRDRSSIVYQKSIKKNSETAVGWNVDLAEQLVEALVTVRLVILLLKRACEQKQKEESVIKNSRNVSHHFLPLFNCFKQNAQTKCSGWNFLNMAVMQRPVIGFEQPAHSEPRLAW